MVRGVVRAYSIKNYNNMSTIKNQHRSSLSLRQARRAVPQAVGFWYWCGEGVSDSEYHRISTQRVHDIRGIDKDHDPACKRWCPSSGYHGRQSNSASNGGFFYRTVHQGHCSQPIELINWMSALTSRSPFGSGDALLTQSDAVVSLLAQSASGGLSNSSGHACGDRTLSSTNVRLRMPNDQQV